MSTPDIAINTLGVLYGGLLISAAFVRAGITEALRIDALFVRDYSEKTRPLNLVAGMLIAGYGAYSLLVR